MKVEEVKFDEVEELEDTFAPAWGFGCGGAIYQCC